MARTQGSPRSHSIAVRASLRDDERAQTASLAAYAFSLGRKLLDARPLEKGEAVLDVTLGTEGTSVRVGYRLQLPPEQRAD